MTMFFLLLYRSFEIYWEKFNLPWFLRLCWKSGLWQRFNRQLITGLSGRCSLWQLALAGFAEYVLHLSRLNPDTIYIHQDSGLVNISYFKFDVDDVSGELDSNRPVPFRMTPNITEFITSVGVNGPLTASMIAAARCLSQPSFKIQAILRAILRDEMISWNKKNTSSSASSAGGTVDQPTDTGGSTNVAENKDREIIVAMVTKAVNSISQRLNNLSFSTEVTARLQSW